MASVIEELQEIWRELQIIKAEFKGMSDKTDVIAKSVKEQIERLEEE